jgi:hypothetical protein
VVVVRVRYALNVSNVFPGSFLGLFFRAANWNEFILALLFSRRWPNTPTCVSPGQHVGPGPVNASFYFQVCVCVCDQDTVYEKKSLQKIIYRQ